MKSKLTHTGKFSVKQARAGSRLENLAPSSGTVTKSLVRLARGDISLKDHINIIKSEVYGTR